jgi:hypothetical protein
VKCWLALVTLLLVSPSFAAKVMTAWVNPTQNTDGTPLTNLAAIRVEWGSCTGADFGTAQASILVAAPATSAPIYPTGLAIVCIRMYARNTAGLESAPSGVVQKTITTLGKPVTLDQPIIIP